MDYGSDYFKKKALLDFEQMMPTLPSKYKTAFWDKVHELTKQMYLSECTRDQAVEILMKVCDLLIIGVKEGSCDHKDLHYAMRVFNNLTFVYGANQLYDMYDGELYGLIEYLDGHDNIDEIEAEYKTFQEKHHLQKKE